MTKSERLKEDLFRLINAAPQHRHNQVLESVEYKLAMKAGDVVGAFEIADGIINGKGKTKAARKRNKRKIQKEDSIQEFI